MDFFQSLNWFASMVWNWLSSASDAVFGTGKMPLFVAIIGIAFLGLAYFIWDEVLKRRDEAEAKIIAESKKSGPMLQPEVNPQGPWSKFPKRWKDDANGA